MKKIFISAFMCFALGIMFTQAQITEERVNFEVTDAIPLSVVFREIQDQSNVTLNYNASDIQGMSISNVSFSNMTVDQVLSYLEQNYPLSFFIDGNSIDVTFIGQKDDLLTDEFNLDDLISLDAVVTTALGIEREKKSLGYAIQEIQGEAINDRNEANITNALTGKVAGLNIVKSSNGPAGSSKIILRGYNSLTGDNQPLIVVDGVPMQNTAGAGNNDIWNPSIDYGNGFSDINPQDIESISVLKGGTAAALYGSRAGNGVILITTKTGKRKKGLGITYSGTFGVEEIFQYPDVQTMFGQGTTGIYNSGATASWGAKLDGSEVELADGSKQPYSANDNIDEYFDKGFSMNHSLSFQNRFDNGTSLYSSATYYKNESYIPGSELERINLMTRALSVFGEDEQWRSDFKVQYIKNKVKNRPLNGNNVNNAYGTLLQLPVNVDATKYSDAVDEFGNHIWYSPNGINPYWSSKYNTNEDFRDRYLLNGKLTYQVLEWLSAEIQAGADLFTDNNENKMYGQGPNTPTGRYSIGKGTHSETNYSFLLMADQDEFVGDWGMGATLGGNLMHSKSDGLHINAGELEVPNFFSVGNSINKPGVSQSFYEKKINSLYGTLQFRYLDYYYLDFTARNDWSSTLSSDNRSYFYPSISSSFVFSDYLKTLDSKPDFLNYGKIRASWATVGNDMRPYQLYNTFNIGQGANGNTVASTQGTKFSSDIENELIKTWEIGFETRMFNQRVNLDFTYYKTNATNQILSIPINPLSGYARKIINAGDIENKGYEIMLNLRPIVQNDFTWDMDFNFSKNENTVNELTEGVTVYGLAGFENIAVRAEPGETYGVIVGSKYNRVKDKNSQFFGQIIVDENGIPTAEDGTHILGNQQPDFLLGITNTFSYKNFTFSFLIDGSFGSEMWSGTNMILKAIGLHESTVVNGGREDIVYKGVVEDGNGGYKPNDIEVAPQTLWQGISQRTNSNFGITEENIYDASNIRLRNINLSYNLSNEFAKNIGVQKMTIGISANNVWMINSHLDGVDPESVYATGTNATGFEYFSSPTVRSYFLNFSVSL